MNSLSKSKHGAITYKEMCIIEKYTDGSLRTVFNPIDYDRQVVERLYDLRRKMLEWEDKQRKKVAKDIGQLNVGLYGEQKTDMSAIAGRFRDIAWNVYQLMGVEHELPAIQITDHDGWHYAPGVHSLWKYSALIRGFDVSFEAVATCRTHLDDSSYQTLEMDYRLANGMRAILLPALERYERVFCAYIERVGQIYPEALEKKNYCQDFSSAYGDAGLDYEMTPGNQCVVERIGHYYWACVMERLYAVYERTDNVVAYSHRRRGFYDYKIVLEPKCDLFLFHETNFGYGRVRYFRSTLSYRGVSAINASLLIFFQGAGKVGFSDYTFNYEVEEESFETCFNQVVDIHSEYWDIGEANFVDKYFRKSLADLSDLLLIVANTDTFLQITTLERFAALTSGARNVLLPDEGFKAIELGLNAVEEKVADEAAETILSLARTKSIDECANDPSVRNLIDQLFCSYDPDSLQLIVKKDLVRNRIIHRLASSLAEGFDIGGLAKGVIPPDDGIYAETYEGFDLISMRIEKAMSVIRPIERLRNIAALTRFESIIDSIATTCSIIGEQAQHYISKEIEPELYRRIPERDRVRDQFKGAQAEMETIRQRKGDTGWIEDQIQQLGAQLQDMNNEISRLSGQKEMLESYIRKARALMA